MGDELGGASGLAGAACSWAEVSLTPSHRWAGSDRIQFDWPPQQVRRVQVNTLEPESCCAMRAAERTPTTSLSGAVQFIKRDANCAIRRRLGRRRRLIAAVVSIDLLILLRSEPPASGHPPAAETDVGRGCSGRRAQLSTSRDPAGGWRRRRLRSRLRKGISIHIYTLPL